MDTGRIEVFIALGRLGARLMQAVVAFQGGVSVAALQRKRSQDPVLVGLYKFRLQRALVRQATH
jgi:hypothetical protein